MLRLESFLRQSRSAFKAGAIDKSQCDMKVVSKSAGQSDTSELGHR